MHGAGGEHKNAFEAGGPCPLLNAAHQLFTVARALALRRHGDGGHFTGLGFGVGVERGTAKDHAIVLDDGVGGDVSLDLGAAALDQGAVFFKRLNQLQNATHIVGLGFTQLFQAFVDDHGADTVVHVDFEQQRAVCGKRQNVAALYAVFAGLNAVLQVKAHIGGEGGGWQLAQQLLGYV